MIFTQKAQSASKNNQPRAWRPLLSVNSEVSEIMAVHLRRYDFAISKEPKSAPHQLRGELQCGVGLELAGFFAAGS
jgi:hypothetical protein